MMLFYKNTPDGTILQGDIVQTWILLCILPPKFNFCAGGEKTEKWFGIPDIFFLFGQERLLTL